jgi:hypothetical protein
MASTPILEDDPPIPQTPISTPSIICFPLKSVESNTDVNPDNNLYNHRSIWVESQVGSIASTTTTATTTATTTKSVNKRIRIGYEKKGKVLVTPTELCPWQSILEAIFSMYPITLNNSNNTKNNKITRYIKDIEDFESKSWVWPPFFRSLIEKKVVTRDYGYTTFKETETVKSGDTKKIRCKTLLYKKGAFFKKHTDSRISGPDDKHDDKYDDPDYNNPNYNRNTMNFATVLIFEPTDPENPEKLRGGDLVLDFEDLDNNKNKIIDPFNILIKEKNQLRLKVSELKEPVIIAFQINIPHEVEVIEEGFRVCHKTNLIIPNGYQYFTNNNMNTNIITNEFILATNRKRTIQKITRYEEKLAKYERKIRQRIAYLENKISVAQIEITDPIFNILSKIELDPRDFHMVVLPTGVLPTGVLPTGVLPTGISAYLETDILTNMSKKELTLYKEIMIKYPYSTIQPIIATRIAYGYDELSEMYCMEDIDELMLSTPTTGKLTLPSFDGNVLYFGNPKEQVFGYRTKYYAEYNDSTYNFVDETVLVIVICVQKCSSNLSQ